MNVIFPWPPKELSPNARCHWAVKARVSKSFRMACKGIARRELAFATWEGFGLRLPVNVRLDFAPPDKRRRDLDNCISSCKSLLDGLADALRVDDKHFVLTASIGAPVAAGAVRVVVT